MLKSAKLIDIERAVAHPGDTLAGQCDWLTRYAPGVRWSDTGKVAQIDGADWPVVRFSGIEQAIQRLRLDQ